MTEDQAATKARVKTAVVIGFVLSVPLMVILEFLGADVDHRSTSLWIAAYEDGQIAES